MVIIIDSNNLLGKSTSHLTHTTRKELAIRLAKYAAKTNHIIMLVFDGGRDYSMVQATDRLTVIDAGPDQSADTTIIKLCTKYSAENTIIITKDRMLRNSAHNMGIATVTPEKFMERILMHEKGRNSLQKDSLQITQYNEENPSIDVIMRKAAERATPNKELIDYERPERQKKSKTLSQSDRIRESLINKL